MLEAKMAMMKLNRLYHMVGLHADVKSLSACFSKEIKM